MRPALLSAVAFGLGFSLVGGASAAPARHDGTWSVRMITEAGSCDASYSYSVAITNGQVRYLQAPGDAATMVNGEIGPDGSVNLAIRRSIAKVDAPTAASAKSPAPARGASTCSAARAAGLPRSGPRPSRTERIDRCSR